MLINADRVDRFILKVQTWYKNVIEFEINSATVELINKAVVE